VRILALTSLYPNPFQPHRAPFIRHQLRLLARDHALRVIAPIAWTDEWRARRAGATQLPPDRRATLDGLSVEHPRYLFPPRVLRGVYGRCFRASVSDAFRRALAEFGPDLVFTPWPYPDGWAAVELGHAAGLPVVLQCHGSDVLLLDRYRGRQRPTAAAVRRADAVIAVSRDIAGRLVDLGAEPSRVRVVYDGVDPTLFLPGPQVIARARVGVADGGPLVLFVGNLVPVKGLDVLIEACGLMPGVRAALIGDGPLRPALQQQIDRLGLTGRVRLLGPRPLTDLPDWYRAADVFALPSYSEGVPNVLLEAAACRTPYVASPVGGIPEIVDRELGCLVPPGDAGRLAQALHGVLAAGRPSAAARPVRTRAEAVREVADLFRQTVRGYAVPRPIVPVPNWVCQ
jgi:glycosyltransferase involved in cell wall biosynthesis